MSDDPAEVLRLMHRAVAEGVGIVARADRRPNDDIPPLHFNDVLFDDLAQLLPRFTEILRWGLNSEVERLAMIPVVKSAQAARHWNLEQRQVAGHQLGLSV